MKSNNQRLDDLENKAGLQDEPDMIRVIKITLDEADPDRVKSTHTWRERLPSDPPAGSLDNITVRWMDEPDEK